MVSIRKMIRNADLIDGKADSSGGKPALFESETRVFRPGIIKLACILPEFLLNFSIFIERKQAYNTGVQRGTETP